MFSVSVFALYIDRDFSLIFYFFKMMDVPIEQVIYKTKAPVASRLFLLFALLALAVVIQLVLKFRNQRKYGSFIRDKIHIWRPLDPLWESYSCNGCHRHMVCGNAREPTYYVCIICHQIMEDSCLKAEIYIPCRKLFPSSGHQWRKGNQKPESVCLTCNQLIAEDTSEYHFTCMWCHKCLHELCESEAPCTGGPLSSLMATVVPANSSFIRSARIIISHLHGNGVYPAILTRSSSVTAIAGCGIKRACQFLISKPQPSRGLKKWLLHEAKKHAILLHEAALGIKGRTTLFFLNPRSGGQAGEQVFGILKSMYPSDLVINLLESGGVVQELVRFIPHIISGNVTVVVGGGDGTLASIAIDLLQLTSILPNLQQLEDLINDKQPSHGCAPVIPVAPLALGTGNDMSCSLGWGLEAKVTGNLASDAQTFYSLANGRETDCDLWKCDVYSTNNKLLKSMLFINYMDLGVAANVALKFALLRKRSPWLCVSRFFNKILYTEAGLRDLMSTPGQNLSSIIFKLDDTVQTFPYLAGIAFCNINSYGGGICASIDTARNNIDNGKLSVLGFRSLLHLGRVQINLDKPIFLGAVSTVEMLVKYPIAYQLDGEAEITRSSIIRISREETKCRLLRNPDKRSCNY